MKQSKADITLNSTGGDGKVYLRILDRDSNKVVCEVEFEGSDFVSALGGRYLNDHPITWYAPDRIGWKTVHKTECLEFKASHAGVTKALAALRRRLESLHPGCDIRIREEDATNPHRRQHRVGNVATYKISYWITSPPENEE